MAKKMEYILWLSFYSCVQYDNIGRLIEIRRWSSVKVVRYCIYMYWLLFRHASLGIAVVLIPGGGSEGYMYGSIKLHMHKHAHAQRYGVAVCSSTPPQQNAGSPSATARNSDCE